MARLSNAIHVIMAGNWQVWVLEKNIRSLATLLGIPIYLISQSYGMQTWSAQLAEKKVILNVTWLLVAEHFKITNLLGHKLL